MPVPMAVFFHFAVDGSDYLKHNLSQLIDNKVIK